MNGEIDKAGLLYCERRFNPQNFHPDYKAAYEQSVNQILARYEKIALSILEGKPEVKIDLKVIKTPDGPLLGIEGHAEEVEKALRKALGDFALPPETKIVFPGKYTEYWESSHGGCEIAKKVAIEMGHMVADDGEILRRGFEFQPEA